MVLSPRPSEALAREAFRNGASAYFLEDSGVSALARAIREAVSGRRYVSPPLRMASIEALRRGSKRWEARHHDSLTRREREALHLTAEGLDLASLADRLSISRRTAESHRDHAMHKLGLHGRAELIQYALDRELIPW